MDDDTRRETIVRYTWEDLRRVSFRPDIERFVHLLAGGVADEAARGEWEKVEEYLDCVFRNFEYGGRFTGPTPLS